MSKPSCPWSAQQVLEAGFLDSRSRLLEIAALLDRIDRCKNAEEGKTDFRYTALQAGLRILNTASSDRTKALLDCWSDPTEAPRESAVGLKNAVGAWDGGQR